MKYNILEKKKIEKKHENNLISLVLETIEKDKQVIIFNRSKNSAEKTAEDIAKVLNAERSEELNILAEEIESTLESPTKQCKKLAKLVRKGVAFHHSGLVSKQREIIEKGFREGLLKVISATPTLAAGINLPAYKVIIKDYKRYFKRGMTPIPVIEYWQMSGRAGRPGKEQEGVSVLCASTDEEVERLVERYIFGRPEEIFSKLAVEPVLKMYMLSVIAIGLVRTKKEIEKFFLNTFYAYQFKDKKELKKRLDKVVDTLMSYGFVTREDSYYIATPTGKRINELYINPDTGHYFLKNLQYIAKTIEKYQSKKTTFALIHFLVNTIEMKPLFTVTKKEFEKLYRVAENYIEDLFITFNPYEDDIDSFLSTIKTTLTLFEWIEEIPEERICDTYSITPGELKYKLEIIEWLLMSLEELANLKRERFLKNFISKLRLRFQYGVREELISLVSTKNIGRVRARKLYEHGIKSELDILKTDEKTLGRIIGQKIAERIKNNVEEDERNKSLLDYF